MEPEAVQHRRELAAQRGKKVDLLCYKKSYKEARDELEKVLAIREEIVDAAGDEIIFLKELAATCGRLVDVEVALDNHDGALVLQDKVIKTMERIVELEGKER